MKNKFTLTIEEIITQDFQVEATDLEEAIAKLKHEYRRGNAVVENPNLETALIGSPEDDGIVRCWDVII